ncbi:hypothetical protein ACO0SA_004560 [Hanseniaspora valbyensis]
MNSANPNTSITSSSGIDSATNTAASIQNDPDYSKVVFLKQLGEQVFQQNMKKINVEFLTITYGSLIKVLIEHYKEDVEKCNTKLKEMGRNIGSRLIDDFYAKVTTQIPRCSNLKDLGNTLSYVGFKLYLNCVPKVLFDENEKIIKLRFDNDINIFSKFVELPDEFKNKRLYYSNIISGVIEGALSGIALKSDVKYVSDTLLGDSTTEIQISNVKKIKDEVPMGQ